jgi:lipopolysaccharide/colanic/teichoic acid biosynthesis glycosyltransferase
MPTRSRLPRGCWVTTFSSHPSGGPIDADMAAAPAGTRHRQSGPASPRLLSGAFQFGALRMPATASAVPRPEMSRARARVRRHQHVIAQELFGHVFTRERRRAERFDQPFVLLLIASDSIALSGTATEGITTKSQTLWTNVIDAVTTAAGDTAVLGWFQDHVLLGAIVPDDCASGLEARVRQELRGRLLATTADRISITSQVYSSGAPRPDESGARGALHILRDASHHGNPAHYRLKRALDWAGSLVLLLILSPVMLLIATLLKLTSPGPVLFRQTRVGQMAKPFTMLKFRTMRVNADPGLHHEFVTRFIRSGAQLHPAGRKALFKLTNDPRVTPLGRILRKTSLDELPQLWNVLRGEMSLVGPRPPLHYEVEQYRYWHWRRVLDAKPGITGLWQVAGRSRTTFDEMVRLDIRYARTCSLWTDIKILLATPRAVMSGKGAG